MKKFKKFNFEGPGAELPYLGILGPKHVFGHILPSNDLLIVVEGVLEAYCEIASSEYEKKSKSSIFEEPGVELPYLGILGPKHIFGHILP